MPLERGTTNTGASAPTPTLAPPPVSAWADSARTRSMISATSNSTPSNSQGPNISGNPNAHPTTTYNPSMGPTPSQVTRPATQSRASTTTASFQPGCGAFSNDVCTLSGFTRKDFKKGDVISLPFHQANINPKVDPSKDDHWRSTTVGPVYSKRRMFIVLFIYNEDLFCLPLYTWGGTGPAFRPESLRREYVMVKNAGDANFDNHGCLHEALIIEKSNHPIDKMTTVVMTGGTKVGCIEDIAKVGRLTQATYLRLFRLWKNLCKEAYDADPWNAAAGN